jgi:tetratricopeptide (TPR) repeat protein
VHRCAKFRAVCDHKRFWGGLCMKSIPAIVLAAACLTLGFSVGYAARSKGPGITLIAGKPAKEAGMAALQEAERRAGKGSWELIGVARVYYLTGDKAKAQALLDQVTSADPGGSDWLRIAALYAEAGDNARAEEYFSKTIAAEPEEDRYLAEIGAWYIRAGQRDKGEALMAKAFAINSEEFWHYMRAAEALLGVAPND